MKEERTLQAAFNIMLKNLEPNSIRPVNKYAWLQILGINDIKKFLKQFFKRYNS